MSLPRMSSSSSGSEETTLHDGTRPMSSAPSRRPPLSLVGRLVAGKYMLTSLIGRGGMGSVYDADAVDTGQPVAIKVLTSPNLTLVNLKRFRREYKATAALRHPNLCHVFEYGKLDDDTPYIAMERLFGETLRERIQQTGPLPLVDVISISLQLLGGLSTAHEAGVLHRDVKPGNVFLTSERGRTPVAKLIDFGLAKLLPSCTLDGCDDELTALTRASLIPGTPHYLAPEQVRAERSLDARVDVWAMGMTIYEMLAGRKVFEGAVPRDAMTRIVMDEIPRIETVRPDVPAEVATALHTALSKNRAVRFRNAGEMGAALLGAWSRIRVAAVARGRRLANGERPSTMPRRKGGG